MAWAIDGAPAGSGPALTARIHAVGHHIVTLSAVNGAGISGSAAIGIEVVRPATKPSVAITAPKDGASLAQGPDQLHRPGERPYDGRCQAPR